MPKEKLTIPICNNAVYQGKGASGFYALWDTELKGLGLRISPSGVKQFILSYRLHGKKIMMGLGGFPALTVEQARRSAKEALYKVSQGINPSIEKKERLQPKLTVQLLCDDFLNKYSIPHKKTWGEDKRRIDSHIIPALGSIPVTDLKRTQVVRLHQGIGSQKKYEANRVIILLSTIFEKGRSWGYVEEMAPNPARNIDLYKEEKRDRWLSPDELKSLVVEIKKNQNIYHRSYFLLLIYTGCRKRELMRAKWRDVNYSQKIFTLPDTKSGVTQYVNLSSAAMNILNEIPRLEGNPYIFPGSREGAHMVDCEKPWRAIRKAAGLEDVRIHDLRRTAGSMMAVDGQSLLVIGKALRHLDNDSTRIYAHLSKSPVQDAMERLGETIEKITKVTGEDEGEMMEVES